MKLIIHRQSPIFVLLTNDDDDEKRCLFATQIIEHNAYSLLIRVDNGLFLSSSPIWALVK